MRDYWIPPSTNVDMSGRHSGGSMLVLVRVNISEYFHVADIRTNNSSYLGAQNKFLVRSNILPLVFHGHVSMLVTFL